MTRGAVALVGLAAACGGGGGGDGALEAAVFRAADTIRFGAPASASRCAGGRELLVGGLTPDGNGVLVWLRAGDSLAGGDYPYLPRGDTTAARGAVAGVRYVAADVARGVTLDSGAARLTVRRGRIGARVEGSGPDPTTAARIRVEARFEGVPVPADTVPCEAAP